MDPGQHVWGKRRQVTLSDVAREAGISQSAVSVVLNGARSGTRVSDSRRKAVLEAAERVGYRPNALARSLQTGRTQRIGVYSGGSSLDSRNSFYAQVLGGILVGAAECRQNTMIHSAGQDESGLLGLVSNRALDGLIVHADENDPILALLGELRVPAVAVADRISQLPSVVVDDVAGGDLQARHLASLGHRHVLLKQSNRWMGSAGARCATFRQVAESLGIRVTERYETFGENDGLDLSDVRVLTDGPDRATAVVGWSDHVAYRICDRLDLLGISIPEQVAVIGFDGFGHACTPKFDLTTIRAPWDKVGQSATHLLHALIEGDSVPSLTTLPVELVRGATT
jgi:LacI family transcriptional regulator